MGTRDHCLLGGSGRDPWKSTGFQSGSQTGDSAVESTNWASSYLSDRSATGTSLGSRGSSEHSSISHLQDPGSVCVTQSGAATTGGRTPRRLGASKPGTGPSTTRRRRPPWVGLGSEEPSTTVADTSHVRTKSTSEGPGLMPPYILGGPVRPGNTSVLPRRVWTGPTLVSRAPTLSR